MNLERTRGVRIAGFDRFGGLHCETSALRKVLAFDGFEVDEEILFGLGGGIGFVFWRNGRMPAPFVGGRNGKFPDFLARTAARLGIELELVQTGSPARAWSQLRAELADDRPAICYGDIFFLPYFHATRHFGGHAFVVYGMDETENRVFVSDRGIYPRTLSFTELARARGSRAQPFPPRHALLRLRGGPPRLVPESIRAAVRDSIVALTKPPIRNLGLSGMRKLGDHLAAAAKSSPANELLDLLMTTYANLELAGTGGAAFRRMYATFLRRVAELGLFQPPASAFAALDRSIQAWTQFLDRLIPAPALTACRIRMLLVEKERTFELGSMEEIRRSGERLATFDPLWGQAAAEIDCSRDVVRALGEPIEEIRRAEAEMCAALAEAVGGLV